MPGSDVGFSFKGHTLGWGCLAFTESRKFRQQCFFSLEKVVGKCLELAHLEFPGLWAFLTLSAEFSSLLPPGTDRREALLQPFRLLSSSQPRISSWHPRCRQGGNSESYVLGNGGPEWRNDLPKRIQLVGAGLDFAWRLV